MATVTPTAAALTTTHTTKAMAADFDAIQNRVAVALAKRERLIKSWTASSTKPRAPLKSQEELDAEDADLFNPTPANLGLGAPIPKEFLDGDVKRKDITSNTRLRHILLGNRTGLQASKPRDGKEKAGSAKRGLDENSSDEDQGRSSLGKAKKAKSVTATNVIKDEADPERKQNVNITSQETIQEPNHVCHSEVKSPVMPSKRISVSTERHSSQKAKAQHARKTKPLVDYDSEEESDSEQKEVIITPASMRKVDMLRIPNTLGHHANMASQNDGQDGHSTITPKPTLTAPPITKDISNQQYINELVKNPVLGSKATSKKPSSKSGSSYSSRGRASTTESEPSDMETAIPLALAPDLVRQTSLAISDSISSATDAKRAKNRQKRQKKREREQQRKAFESSAASGVSEKSMSIATGGSVITKKIKDRLLNADGK